MIVCLFKNGTLCHTGVIFGFVNGVLFSLLVTFAARNSPYLCNNTSETQHSFSLHSNGTQNEQQPILNKTNYEQQEKQQSRQTLEQQVFKTKDLLTKTQAKLTHCLQTATKSKEQITKPSEEARSNEPKEKRKTRSRKASGECPILRCLFY